ncbi:MAG: hypothetical protein M1326_07605, partial [Cyanobacteria bacterium]|nr:hypothetical protein [Cyanobacteriota bacterium]
MKSNKLLLSIYISVGVVLTILSLRNYFFEHGVVYFSELSVLSNYSWLINKLSYAWNDYYVLGHTQVGWPLAPGASPLFATTNLITSLIDSYFMLLLKILFKDYSQFVDFFLALFFHFIFMFAFINFYIKENYSKFPSNKRYFLSFLAGILFMINPITVGRFGSGGVRYIFSESLFPLFILLHFLTKKYFGFNIRYIQWLSLFILVSFYQVAMWPHFFIIFLLFVFLDFILTIKEDNFISHFKKYTITYSLVGIFTFLIFSYVLIPSFLFKEIFTSNAESGFFSLSSVESLGQYSTVPNLIKLFAESHASHILINPSIVFYLIALLAVVSIFTFSKKKRIYFSVLLILFIFFAKGVNEPLSGFSIFLYINLPFMHAFREPSQFASFIVFLYAWVIPLGIVSFGSMQRKLKGELIYLLGFTIIILLIISNLKFISGNFEGVLRRNEIPKEYQITQEFINNNAKGKVLYLPYESSVREMKWYKLGVGNSSHYSVFHQYLPLSAPIVNAYQNDYSNTYSQRFMEYIQSIRDPKLLAIMLDKIGVEYIIVDNNIRSSSYQYKEFNDFKNSILKTNEFFSLDKTFGNIEIYHLKTFTNGFFSLLNPLYVVGDLTTFEDIYKVNPLLLNNNQLIFLNQENNFNQVDLKNKKIIFDNTGIDDLIGNQLVKRYGIDLTSILDAKINSKGWIDYEPLKLGVNNKLINFALDFQSKQAIGVEEKTAHTFNLSLVPDKYILYIHPLFGDKYKENPLGKLEILVDEKKYVIDLSGKDRSYLKWIKLGEVKINKDSTLTLKNLRDGLALIDGIVLVKKNGYKIEKDQIEKKLDKAIIINNLNEIKEDGQNLKIQKVHYKKIDPTKYYVNISTSSAFLTFKQNYSPYWKLDKKNSIATNYFGDGYFISKSKNNQKLFYGPQK